MPRVDIHNLHNGLNHLRPARRIIGEEGNRQLGKLGRAPRITHLAAHPDGQTVVLRIVHGHGGAYGVAIAAIHALLFHDCDGILAVHDRRTNRSGRAGGDQSWDLAHLGQRAMLNLRGKTVNAEDGDVGTMHRATHIEAAGHCNAQFRRKILVREAVVDSIHHTLDQA